MTSFKSVDEFVREYEKVIHICKKVGAKYPDLSDPSVQDAMMSVDVENDPISENIKASWVYK